MPLHACELQSSRLNGMSDRLRINGTEDSEDTARTQNSRKRLSTLLLSLSLSLSLRGAQSPKPKISSETEG